MAQLTYLDIVNKVLVKLRETKVNSVDYTKYSALIGAFVNDAKKEVESAYTWQALRTGVNFTSVIGQREYDLTIETTEDSRLLYDEFGRPMVFDLTPGNEFQLKERTHDYVETQFRLQYPTQTQTQPCIFSLRQAGEGFIFTFLEAPLEARDYLAYFCVPQEELANGTDTIKVPWRPVRDLALVYALDERGEEIGEPGNMAEVRYRNSLADAIAMDSLGSKFRTDFVVQ